MKKIIIILPLLIFSIIVINAQSNLLDLSGSTNPLAPNQKSQEFIQQSFNRIGLQQTTNTVVILDSTIHYSASENDSIPDDKTSYEYDERGFATIMTSYDWKNNEWSPASKTECKPYDAELPEYVIYHTWNNDLQEFYKLSKFSYEFTTGTDSTFTTTTLIWDKNELTFIQQGKMVEYFQSGKIIKDEQFNWNNNTWNLNYKNNYTYSEEESDYSVTGYVYDDDIADFRNSSKTEYSFDESNLTKESVKHEWNKTEEKWELDSKKTTKYDANNNILEQALYYWVSDKWYGDFEVFNTYNENGQKTEYLERKSSNWNRDTEEWDGYSRKDLTFYDEAGNKNYQEKYSWAKSTSSWSLNEKLYFYYSELELPTTVTVSTPTDVDVYPNPASDYFNVDMKDKTGYSLNIYNTNGALVLTRELQPGHNTIPIENLAKGIYVCKITGKKDSFASKMLVE